MANTSAITLSSERSSPHSDPASIGGFVAGLGVAGWGATVAALASAGILAAVPPLGVAALVSTGIALPTLAFFAWAPMRAFVETLGLRRLTAFHVWRVPAALLFFWYGAQGQLPLTFVALAGIGDLLAGLLALWVVTGRQSVARYRFAHRFGLADFVLAVGTGITFTLLRDPAMANIRELPLALIPYFGVGLSGATHLMAFALMAKAQR